MDSVSWVVVGQCDFEGITFLLRGVCTGFAFLSPSFVAILSMYMVCESDLVQALLSLLTPIPRSHWTSPRSTRSKTLLRSCFMDISSSFVLTAAAMSSTWMPMIEVLIYMQWSTVTLSYPIFTIAVCSFLFHSHAACIKP
jgi:hypothetical protein